MEKIGSLREAAVETTTPPPTAVMYNEGVGGGVACWEWKSTGKTGRGRSGGPAGEGL